MRELDKFTVEHCIKAAKYVIEREGCINAAGITYDGAPVFGKFDGTQEQIEVSIQHIIELDKQKRDETPNN